MKPVKETMSQSFYDLSVASYLQILGGVQTTLARAVEFAEGNPLNLDELVHFRLHDDMAPLSFQLISVWHHSLGSIKGMQAGVFEPPPKMPAMSFDDLRNLVFQAAEFLRGLPREEVDALSGRDMVFRLGEREIPFTTDNFLSSFSLPNFHFHSTTSYAILRQHGVPLGKRDFLGQLRVGAE